MRGRERREKEREGRTRLGGENEFPPWASKRMTNEIGRERESETTTTEAPKDDWTKENEHDPE